MPYPTGKQRPDFVGLIGSHSKAKRFRRRLVSDGLPTDTLNRLTSPIGQSGPVGKEPGVIALAALAEVLNTLKGARNQDDPHRMMKTPHCSITFEQPLRILEAIISPGVLTIRRKNKIRFRSNRPLEQPSESSGYRTLTARGQTANRGQNV
ncbi:MAG: hypothetical protein Ct9H300mP16_14390 [Pseudomonadota bacterium]|nr:MAG: hypothetical protein Ct9H300mP16_14390 [Pseudomonadota bacterium]